MALAGIPDTAFGDPLPETGAGVGYVRLEGSPDPIRVRAAYVTDDDIRAMAAAISYRPLPGGDE